MRRRSYRIIKISLRIFSVVRIHVQTSSVVRPSKFRVFGILGIRVFGVSGVVETDGREFGSSGVRDFGSSGVLEFGCSGACSNMLKEPAPDGPGRRQ